MKTTALVALAAAGFTVLAILGVRGTPASERPQTVPAQPSARLADARRSLPGPPPVPAAAETLTAVTMTVRSGVVGRGMTTQIVTRTRDRVRRVVEGEDKEWLFVRNPVSPDRASGFLVDHRAKQIVEYDDTSLLTRQGLRGWADVIAMRFDPRLLPTLQATGRSERRHRAEFRQFVSRSPDQPGVVEVWWSEPHLLPLRLTVREGRVLLSAEIVGLVPESDSAALELPARRFPDYHALDVDDTSDHRN